MRNPEDIVRSIAALDESDATYVDNDDNSHYCRFCDARRSYMHGKEIEHAVDCDWVAACAWVAANPSVRL